MHVYKQYNLLAHNTFKIEAKADTFITYQTSEELQNLILGWKDNRPDLVLHIGCGSNLLFLHDFKGVILHSEIKGITIVEENDEAIVLKIGGGEVVDDVIAHCIARNWYGIENLSAIPGEMGAAAVQNIGAYGVEIEQDILKVEGINLQTGELHTFNHQACQYAYRSSIFKTALKGKYAITHIYLKLSKEFKPNLNYQALQKKLESISPQEITALKIREMVIAIRNQRIPSTDFLGSGGSFFMNPILSKEKFEQLLLLYPDMPYYPTNDDAVKVAAGWLIEQCGWKGKRIGNVGVYEKQALILVNYGGATGQEVKTLSDAIIQSVKQKFGITLYPEVNFID